MKKAWPGIHIITFNSSTEAEEVQPLTNALTSTTHSSSEPSKCSQCKNAAPLACKDCKGLPAGHGTDMIMTWYCSSVCQKEYWKMHKKDCKAAKARRLLYRAASLTKALFYIHQETTFTWEFFEKIGQHGPYRVVFLNQDKTDNRKTLLVPFSTVTDIVSDSREQEAFLTHLSCNEAVAKFGPMLIGMVKGVMLSIEEVMVIPKNSVIEILPSQGKINNIDAVRKDGTHHTILRVTLNNSEQYAIDLTGAQYGHQHECLNWQDYIAARVEKIVQVDAFGIAKRWLADNAQERGYPWNRVQELNNYFVKEVQLLLGLWTRQGGSIDALLASQDKEYEEKKDALIRRVKGGMELARKDSIRDALWCRE